MRPPQNAPTPNPPPLPLPHRADGRARTPGDQRQRIGNRRSDGRLSAAHHEHRGRRQPFDQGDSAIGRGGQQQRDAGQQARTLDDVLGNISGVTQTNTLGGTRDAFIKRGFGSNNDGSVLVDGVRTPVLHSYLATIDRVEVLKARRRCSTDAGSGRRDQPRHAQAGRRLRRLDLGLAQSHGGSSATFDLTGPVGHPGCAGGTLAFRLTGQYDTSCYWRSFAASATRLIAPALSWHDANTSIDVSYQYVDYTTPFDRGTVLVNGQLDDALRYRRYEEAWSQSTGIQETLRARVEHRFSDAWRVRATYGWGRDRYDQYITRATAFNSTTGALTRSSDANLGRNDSDQIATLGLLGNVTLAGMNHAIYIGGEYERQRSFRGDTIRGKATKGFNLYDPCTTCSRRAARPTRSRAIRARWCMRIRWSCRTR